MLALLASGAASDRRMTVTDGSIRWVEHTNEVLENLCRVEDRNGIDVQLFPDRDREESMKVGGR
jgi:hypothetical protein